MNNKKILRFEIINTIFIIILGIILHFAFKWSSENTFIGTFSAVNESIWEHLKLIFFPMVITTFAGHFYLKDVSPNYLQIKTKSILFAMLSIVILYYCYTGILGNDIAFINISIFIIAVIIGEFYTYKNSLSSSWQNNTHSLIILTIIFLVFAIFTFNPPHIGIFKDPVTNTYGIYKDK